MKLIDVKIYDGRLPELIKYCIDQGFGQGHLITVAYRTWWFTLWVILGRRILPHPYKFKEYYRLSSTLWFDYPSFSALPLYEAESLELLNVGKTFKSIGGSGGNG